MEPLAIAAALLSGLMHASWNAAVKSARDPNAAMAAQVVVAGVVAFGLMWIVGPPPIVAVPWVLASSVISAGTLVTIRRAYATGAFSVVYPLARSLGPGLVVAAGLVLGFGGPDWPGLVGIGLIAAAVLLFVRPVPGVAISHAVLWALATAVLTAGFIIVDSLGVRAAGSALGYGLAVSAMNGVIFAAIEGRSVVPSIRREWRIALFAPPISIGSYLLILWVWQHHPPALGAALRDSSLIFAALIAWRLMGERPSPTTWAAIALATAGIVSLRFG